MYIPIMKTKQEEMNVCKELNYCFSEKITPLIEILNDKYEKKYELDDEGKKAVELKPGNKNKTAKIKPSKPEDIITLQYINKNLNGSKVFIDYFRFNRNVYKNKYNLNKVNLALLLSNNESIYIDRLKAISNYENMIPVISLKSNFIFSSEKLIEIIKYLQKINSSIAIRIENKVFSENYIKIVKQYLRKSDYLLYDINENSSSLKVSEFKDIIQCKTDAKRIILNSPRLRKYKNSDYENCCITTLIDNSIAKDYKDYGLDGFGDYGGLVDKLSTSGGNGKGSALALIYSFKDNGFYSFCNKDTYLGVKGYKNVVKDILTYEEVLDEKSNCEAYKKIKRMYCKNLKLKKEFRKWGNWSTWINIILTRYIHQMYINL